MKQFGIQFWRERLSSLSEPDRKEILMRNWMVSLVVGLFINQAEVLSSQPMFFELSKAIRSLVCVSIQPVGCSQCLLVPLGTSELLNI
jgi:hypothetical protein